MKRIHFMVEYSRVNRLSEMGDPLEKMNAAVESETFSPNIEYGAQAGILYFVFLNIAKILFFRRNKINKINGLHFRKF